MINDEALVQTKSLSTQLSLSDSRVKTEMVKAPAVVKMVLNTLTSLWGAQGLPGPDKVEEWQAHAKSHGPNVQKADFQNADHVSICVEGLR